VKAELAGMVTRWMEETGDPRAKGRTGLWDEAPYSGPKFKGAPVDIGK